MGKAKLTEMEYTTIKQLLGKGYEGLKVAEIVGRGRGLVSTVNNTASYKEYVQRGKATRAKYKKTEKEVPQQLPLDTPKKTTLDLREDVTIKFDNLIDAVEMMKRTTATGSINVRREVAYSRAKVHLEQARLWLKEVF